MGAHAGSLTRVAIALAAAALAVAAGAREAAVGGLPGAWPLVALAPAGALVLAGALANRPEAAALGVLLAAGCYSLALWRAGGGDAGAAVVAAVLWGSLALARLAADAGPGATFGPLALRAAGVGAGAVAGGVLAWLVLAAGGSAPRGGLALLAVALAAAVAAIVLVGRLARG